MCVCVCACEGVRVPVIVIRMRRLLDTYVPILDVLSNIDVFNYRSIPEIWEKA